MFSYLFFLTDTENSTLFLFGGLHLHYFVKILQKNRQTERAYFFYTF